MIRPRTATRLRATGRPKNFDINPITTGPTRKPQKPTVVTAAIPGPGPKTGSRPAALKRMGTRLELPSPATAKPPMAKKGPGAKGRRQADNDQRAAQAHDKALAKVDNHAVSAESANGHRRGVASVADRGNRDGNGDHLPHVNRRPILQSTFTE